MAMLKGEPKRTVTFSWVGKRLTEMPLLLSNNTPCGTLAVESLPLELQRQFTLMQDLDAKAQCKNSSNSLSTS